ncbi:Uncharacterized protein FWK35_00026038 [Aphis craccivora]|uniref:Uncharacterized protein n=1 Tax=Aphis craccivora TaxID=307492 RepID=A0A6G0W1C7_APHCR|nr:Uncharacterized protein FWK35_00026038 [Aphis craccivora]
MDRLEQLASAVSFNIETQFHINPVQGEWHNYTACFYFHIIITAHECILVPYEDEIDLISTSTQWNSVIRNESMGPSAHQVDNKTRYVYVGSIKQINTGWNCAKRPSNTF